MKFFIIDNDRKAVKQLQGLLNEISSKNKSVGSCSSVKSAIQWFKKHPVPDLVFSVVELSDGLSFEIFKKIKQLPPVIFTCKYSKYALDAFKTNSIHFLLKPIKKEELQEALKKYQIGIFHRRNHNTKTRKSMPHFQERFLVTVGKQLKLVKRDDIAYFYTENKIVYLITFEGPKYATEFTLEQLEQLLDPAIFFRINRQFIINISAIVKMIPTTKSRLQVFLQPQVNYSTTTSSGRTDDFYKWILGYFKRD